MSIPLNLTVTDLVVFDEVSTDGFLSPTSKHTFLPNSALETSRRIPDPLRLLLIGIDAGALFFLLETGEVDRFLDPNRVPSLESREPTE